MSEEKNLSYLVIGAGGTGGPLAAFLARSGRRVSLIARGSHLSAIREKGLRIEHPGGSFTVHPQATTMEDARETPDVIFVCVKGYSLPETVPFIRRIAGPETVVIPILNLYGTGGRLQQQLPELLVTDGCIYIAAMIQEPGVIRMKGDIFRVVFGTRSPQEERPVLRQIEQDLKASGILVLLSPDIRRDTLLKFSYVSPQGACGLYYGVPAGPIQQPGEIRDCFVRLVREIDLLAHAMGITFQKDIVARNLKILDDLTPDMTTSLQRDIAAHHASELDGLIYEVVRMGQTWGVELPEYEKIAAKLKETLP